MTHHRLSRADTVGFVLVEFEVFGDEERKIALPVTLTLLSGERIQGDLMLTRPQNLHDALNRPEQFVEFEARDGRAMAIAKAAISTATTMQLPRTDQMAKSSGAGDARKLLGVDSKATHAAIRAAYRAKVRLYHPDQFANHPLPKEVSEYLTAMFIHIQAAYEELLARPDHVPGEAGGA